MKRDETAELIGRETLSSDAFLLHFRSDSLFESFVAGQFTMVRIPERVDLLLRRPYSFCDRRPEERSFSLLVKTVGPGTKALAELAVGSRVDCLGPLGSSFRFPDSVQNPVIVAGGVGIAPFVAFCRALAARGRRAKVLLGGRRAPDLYLRSEFEAMGMDVTTSTEDGSHGRKGLVTDLLEEVLPGVDAPLLYSCGPTPMLVKVARIAAELGIPHQVSLERRMGCGMGCCLGCVVFARTEKAESGEYVRCCTEGPVFDAGSLNWERDPYPL